jgi:hypothetical protein
MSWGMGASEVSTLLWRERQLLDLLVFKMEEEQLILAASRPHLLGPASAEVAQVLEQISQCEAEREAATRELAAELGLSPPARLGELVAATEEPWTGIFNEHRNALVSAVERIRSLAAGTKALLAARLTATADALALLGHAPVEAYAAADSHVPAGGSGRLVRGSL